jgi:Bacterial archaeo-eukaryotic release factor family 10/eRF1 domain 3
MDVMTLVDRLADFTPVDAPFISLYASLLPDDRGRTHVEAAIRKELQARGRTAGDFFEALPLAVPIERHQLFIDRRPHLYPLARLYDQYRRYAAVVLDAHVARVFVFGLGEMRRQERVQEVVETLDRVVREEQITQIVLAGAEPMLSVLRHELPAPLAERVIDAVSLDADAPEHEVFEATLVAVRVQDAITDAEKIERLVNEYRGGGLAVIGLQDTLEALARGQVDEVLMAGRRDGIRRDNGDPAPGVADELVIRARQTGAAVSIIEDAALLADVGGVGGLLRYRVDVQRAA